LFDVEPTPQFFVTSFYRFLPLVTERMVELRSKVTSFMQGSDMLGLVLFASEGVNGTVAGSQSNVSSFRELISSELGVRDISFKNSTCGFMPFHRLSVEIRDEIVGMKRTDLVPDSTANNHLTPIEWHAMLASPEPKILIDTRNEFETTVGKFRGAIDSGMKRFSDWAQFLDQAELPKEIPIMIYCTGGIRCEKAILEMQARGHENVVQLRDGILGYLEEFPDGFYDGECFVFDDRVAVDNHLQPSAKFGICPRCGLTSDDQCECAVCSRPYFVCTSCKESWEPVCTKPCRDLWLRHGADASRHQPRA